MFKERKLRKRISELEHTVSKLSSELSEYRIAEKEGIEPCVGQFCRNCEHAVYMRGPWIEPKLLGCSKNCKCPSYARVKKVEVVSYTNSSEW